MQVQTNKQSTALEVPRGGGGGGGRAHSCARPPHSLSFHLQGSVAAVLGALHLSLVLAVLGLGRAVSCWLSSHLGAADCPRVASLAAYCVLQCLVFLFGLAWRPAADDAAVFYAAAFAWGVTDALAHCHVMGE